MLDGWNRRIDYLRISVTDRCNFRCQYCMPEQGMTWFDRAEILSYEEIHHLVQTVFSPLGLRKIRITGGEPLLRRNLDRLIESLHSIPGISDLALSTNGLFLEQQAEALAKAGLRRVNVSLDTLDRGRFAEITRGGDVERVMRGIRKALELGLHPVKLNCVVLPGLNAADVVDLARLTVAWPVHMRFIEFMPVGDRELYQAKGTFGAEDMLVLLHESFDLAPTDEAPQGNGPARYYRIADAQGTIGLIHPMSRHFCDSCNRFRLTADGRVKACLLKGSEVDLKGPLRSGATSEELCQLVQGAMALKPEWHQLGVELQDLT
ncbi:MAG: GTP 3',8-cyclase MoaA, partial [Cyanobacteria bacterium REEB65]|nr:GTP 3',8-cyclase MoaA [Cyanobacteria bacterium REEB65]